jgi:hypothetical protein
LIVTLTSLSGVPLPGRTVALTVDVGSISPSSDITNSAGQISAVFDAPDYSTHATITASFAGDNEYQASSENSSCTVYFQVTITFRKPDGSPLVNTEIYYGFSGENVAKYLGITDNEGKLVSNDPRLADKTVYFRTSDGKYAGSSSIGSAGGAVASELTEVFRPVEIFEPPISWIVAAVVTIAITIGVAVFVKRKRRTKS